MNNNAAPVRKVMQKRTFIKLAREGRLVMVDAYSYDDMRGGERTKTEMPVLFREENEQGSYKEGVYNLHAWVVNMSQLRIEKNGDVFMRVHSNENATFRILDKAPAKPVLTEGPADTAALNAIFDA